MNQPDPATYPCPACHAPANLATGCPGCSRQPDSEAAEVIRLGGTIQGLTAEVERARQGYAEAVQRLQTAQRQRNELAERVRTRMRTEAAQAPASTATPPASIATPPASTATPPVTTPPAGTATPRS